MKVVVLGDVHIGARNDSLTFTKYHISFFTEQLFPFLKENNIKRVVQLGDIFDRRKFVNFQVLNEWKRHVFDWLLENEIEMDIIVGNHDVYFKNTNDVNSPILLLKEYHNINAYVQTTEVMVGGTTVLFVPWINDSNVKATMEMVKKTKATVAMGHFEFDGFEMDKGHKHEGGTNSSKFKKFDTVLSGHFHHKSEIGRAHV
jgi:DNA repair exonuclease SbcCD nuclease subunit